MFTLCINVLMQIFNQSKVVSERCKMVALVTTKIKTKNEIEGAEKLWEHLCIPPCDLFIPKGNFYSGLVSFKRRTFFFYIFEKPHV